MKHISRYILPAIFDTNLAKEYDLEYSIDGDQTADIFDDLYSDAYEFLTLNPHADNIDFPSLRFFTIGLVDMYFEFSGYYKEESSIFRFNWDNNGNLKEVSVVEIDGEENYFIIWEK